MRPVPQAARRHYHWSLLLARRAVREARAVQGRGAGAVAGVVTAHQIAASTQAQAAVTQMLAEQAIAEQAEALLNSPAFTTTLSMFSQMLEQVETEFQFDRLVESLVQDAGRAAESVATTVTPRVGYVRYLSPPSCARCAVLAGRVYRYSTGFLRHPNCDCVMVPTTSTNPAAYVDPVTLLAQGEVTGLSKADRRAIADGADFAQVVNVRQRSAGLRMPGRVLARNGRPTPEGIYATTKTREQAVQALIAAGYVR